VVREGLLDGTRVTSIFTKTWMHSFLVYVSGFVSKQMNIPVACYCFAGLYMGHIYLSHSHPISIYACPIPWDSHYIILILIWNTIQLKLLNL